MRLAAIAAILLLSAGRALAQVTALQHAMPIDGDATNMRAIDAVYLGGRRFN